MWDNKSQAFSFFLCSSYGPSVDGPGWEYKDLNSSKRAKCGEEHKIRPWPHRQTRDFEPQLFSQCSGKCRPQGEKYLLLRLASYSCEHLVNRMSAPTFTDILRFLLFLFRPSRHTPTQTKTQPIDSQIQSMVPELCFAIPFKSICSHSHCYSHTRTHQHLD